MTYNVNRSEVSESLPDTCWSAREPRIIALIKKIDPDVLCLQECRKLGDSDLDEFMLKLKDYKYFTFYPNATKMALGLIIAYKPTRFLCVESGTTWLSSTPATCSDNWGSGWGRIMAHMKLLPVIDSKVISNKAFFVFTTHFGLGDNERMMSCLMIPIYIASIAKGLPFVLGGDFNFGLLKDDDKQLHERVLAVKLNQWSGVIYDIQTGITNNTYVPYTYEKAYKEILCQTNRLDHIYGEGLTPESHVNAISFTMLEKEPEVALSIPNSTPSDHLPLVVIIGV